MHNFSVLCRDTVWTEDVTMMMVLMMSVVCNVSMCV